MIINQRRNKLLKRLRDKKYREAFVEESVNVGIPFQIKALREQRDLTQKDFEKMTGIKQSQVSLRLENPDYSGFTLYTLKKIAAIYDIGLIVRFAPISDLVEWDLNLDSESLKALSYEDDPYFKTSGEQEATASSDSLSISLPQLADIISLEGYKAKQTALSNSETTCSYRSASHG